MPVFGQLEKFRVGEDWEQYVAVLKNYLGANSVTDAIKQKQILLASVGMETYQLMCTLLAPDKPESKSFDELVNAVRDHVKPPPSRIAARYKFYTLSRKEGESVAEFVVNLRRAAQDCKFKDLNEHLRDRFIVAVGDKTIQTKLLSMADEVTFSEALQVALAMESAELHAADIQAAEGATKVAAVNKISTTSRGPCFGCGGDHFRRGCRHKDAVCSSCGRKGHLSRVCRSSDRARPSTNSARRRDDSRRRNYSRNVPPRSTNVVRDKEAETLSNDGSEVGEEQCYTIGCVEKLSGPKIEVSVQIQGKKMKMQVDTGASLSLISKETYHKLGDIPLRKFKHRLATYTGEEMKVLGCIEVDIKYEDQRACLPLVVVDGCGPSLLGRNWLPHLRLDWHSVCRIQHTGLDDLLAEYADVFSPDLSRYTGPPVKLLVDSNVKPRFFRPRPVPYAIKEKVRDAIEENVRLGIWEATDYSDWATPIVPILKRDNSVRLCGDYKVTVNQACKVDPFPLPRIEDIFAELHGGQHFTKIDLHAAYSQIPVDEESQGYLTVTTHLGLFKVKRLPFGVNAAVGIFQRLITSVLQGLPGVCVYLDDILVTGQDTREHLRNLRRVLERLHRAGFRANKKKCEFLKSSVEYLGHRIDAEGLHPTSDKVRAVKEAPEPTSKTELRCFLGLINYYSKFLPNLSTILSPLHHLLKRDAPWVWNSAARVSFQRAKEAISSSKVLVHYDPDMPLVLETDASPCGIGAVLSHTFPGGSVRPVAFASRRLSSAEVNYSQVDREALSLIFGVTKFHHYLYGRKFILVTDHKPLTHLFKPDVPVPAMASPRIRRWALTLSAYDYNITYKKGTDIPHADALSRLPLSDLPPRDYTPQELVLMASLLDSGRLVTSAEVKRRSRRETTLSQVLHWVKWGWPARDPGGVYSAYFTRRHELSVSDGCLLWGSRVVIPEGCRGSVLDMLHDTHLGMTRMKATARSYVWWPGVDKDIEEAVRTCPECDAHQNSPPVAELHPWEWPSTPWSRVHVDHAGPFMGKLFLILIDSHSKWLEVKMVPNTSTAATVDALNSVFATHGLPVVVVTDNGTAFTSEDFAKYCRDSGIKHVRTAPRHPSTNGLAERAVQIFKSSIVKMGESLPWNARINKFLFKYRTTPQSTTQETPCQLLMGREIRTGLSLIRSDVSSRVQERQLAQGQSHDKKARTRYFSTHDKVYTDLGGSLCVPGVIESATGPLSYRVLLEDGRVVKRHVDQIRQRHATALEVKSPATSLPRREHSVEPNSPSPAEMVPVPLPLSEVARPDEAPEEDASGLTPRLEPRDVTTQQPPPTQTPRAAVDAACAGGTISTPAPRRSGRVRHAPDRWGY